MRVVRFLKSGPSLKIRFCFFGDFEGYFGVKSKIKVIITCKKMEADEKKRWNIGLINTYRLVLDQDEVTEACPGA